MGKEGSRGFFAGPSESSYLSRRDIQRRQKHGEPVRPMVAEPSERSLEQWTDYLTYISKMRKELLPSVNKVEYHFTDGRPKLIALIGDAHIGGDCDYQLLEQEVQAVARTDGAHAMLLGDLVDGYFFGMTCSIFMPIQS